MKRTLLAVLASVALAGGLAACETATPYQKLNPANAMAGGYTDVELNADHWRVSFSGNSMTSRETAKRCKIVRRASAYWGPGYGPWGYPDPWGPAYVSEFNRYDVSADIVMGHGPRPPGGKALDAHEVMMNLGPGIQRPKA